MRYTVIAVGLKTYNQRQKEKVSSALCVTLYHCQTDFHNSVIHLNKVAKFLWLEFAFAKKTNKQLSL